MKKFGWAFIGCGGIAEITARELLKSGDGEIISAWNRTPERATDFCRKFGGSAYESPEAAILAPGVDGVYIAVTANMHEHYMRMCISNHKAVLCEKPFTVNASQARAVFENAKQENVYVSEAMWTWHNATACKVKEWVQSGIIGEIREVNCYYSFPMILFSKKERHTSPEMIGGALLDIGVYGIRYCYELFGMPKEIMCEGRLSNGIDLGETVLLKYDTFTAKLIISRDQNHGEKLEITGEHGKISVPMFHMAQKATLSTTKKEVFRDKSYLYGTQFSNTAEEIRSGAKSGIKISPESTVACMEIMDICRRQMGLVYPCEQE